MAEFASNGKADAGLATGIIGTALGVLNGGLGILGGMGNGWRSSYGYGMGYGNGYGVASVVTDLPVGREAFELSQRAAHLECEEAVLQSEKFTDSKLAEVYERLAKTDIEQERINNAKWTEQMVWNTRQDARIAVLESKVNQLMGMTELLIKYDKVQPAPTAPTA